MGEREHPDCSPLAFCRDHNCRHGRLSGRPGPRHLDVPPRRCVHREPPALQLVVAVHLRRRLRQPGRDRPLRARLAGRLRPGPALEPHVERNGRRGNRRPGPSARLGQTGSQAYQPHGPNAYHQSVFYQWYWIAWNPPVVGANTGDNHLVPSVDNAWLAASLITIRQYAEAHGHTAMAQKAEAILADMDFRLWYHPDSHRFSWGDVENPQGGALADYYSNENRIINVVARALGDLSAEEFRLSLAALAGPPGAYNGITVEKMAWDGSYFTYAAPALFIREMGTSYGRNTLVPATQAQIAYARNQRYAAWGLSDCFDVGFGGYVQQGAPPVPAGVTPETRPGLVTPHAAGLALITPLAGEAVSNLQAISTTFGCAYEPSYGFRDAVMARPGAPDYGQCSARYSALAQEWLFLALVNHETGFIWRYFYRHPGVLQAHIEMYGGARVYLPLALRGRGP